MASIVYIVFDLDDTLVDTRGESEPECVGCDKFKVSIGTTYIRPHLDMLINYLEELDKDKYHIYVYSAGGSTYVKEVTDVIFPEGLLKGTYSMNNCDYREHTLTKVLPAFMNKKRTIVIDDRTDVYIPLPEFHVIMPPFHSITTEDTSKTRRILTKSGFNMIDSRVVFEDIVFDDVESVYDIYALAIINNFHLIVKNMTAYMAIDLDLYVPILGNEMEMVDEDTLKIIGPDIEHKLTCFMHTVRVQKTTGKLSDRTYKSVLERGTEELLIEIANMRTYRKESNDIIIDAKKNRIMTHVITSLNNIFDDLQ